MSTTDVQSQPLVIHEHPGMDDHEHPNFAIDSKANSDGRKFAPNGKTARYITQGLIDLQKQIRALEKVEKDLALKYGRNVNHIDSVDIRREANARKIDSDKDSLLHSDQLHQLYHLRKQYASRKPKMTLLQDPSSSIPTPSRHVDASRFWAVVIGINGYAHRPLKGCVSDAVHMGTFLYENLGVPKDRIQYLIDIDDSQKLAFSCNTIHPSRVNIIATLQGLIDNPDIDKDENIIIYFAGHGTLYPEVRFSDIDSIEALCPIDRGDMDENGAAVLDISDREINTFLSEISRAKGRKITVILDCCHAGGATRAPLGGNLRMAVPVGLTSAHDLLLVAEEYLSKRFLGYKSILSSDWLPDMDSHVILAACEAFEYAKEVVTEEKYTTSGYFTTHLLPALRFSSLNNKTTYHAILDLIPFSDMQTPVVAGTQMDAFLWFQK